MSKANNEENTEEDLLQAALEYAERGWRVLPLHEPDPTKEWPCTCRDRDCKSPGKHPRIKGWRQKATTEGDQIKSWWSRWSTANVGIATGDGLVVVDVDPRNGGDRSLAGLEEEHGQFETLRIRTGSGGQHIYLAVDGPVGSRNGWLPGIDLKGDGGYVLAPPSLHASGDRYVVAHESPLGPAPEWLSKGIGTAREGESADLTAEHLRQLAAPGETLEEKVRWTREAAARIPNDESFDDRNVWIGMAHAIKTSCGVGAEEEAFEIFDEFSQRWRGPYDLDETRRVWDSLGPPRATSGYRKLHDLARSHDYEYPEDHPWHAQNEFDVDGTLVLPAIIGAAPPYVPSPFKQLNADWTWEDIFAAIATARALMPAIPPQDARVLESIILTKIASVARSWPAAQEIWRSFARAPVGTTEVIAGRAIIRAADPTDINLEEDYVVDGLIPAAAVGEVIADYSMGKTWFLLALGLCVAFGVPFFGQPVQKKPVVYFAYEGQGGLWKRAAGWLVAHGLLPEEFTLEELGDRLAGRLIVAKIPPRFDQAQIESLIRDTVRHYGAGLVIIDTRGKSLGAELDENSADSANLVQGILSAIAQATDATTISAHHKPLNGANRGRGSSAWTQGGDFAFTINGTREDFEDGKPVTLKTVKFRDDESPRPLSFRLRSPIELTVDGMPWRSAVIEPVTPQQAIPMSLRGQVYAEILREPGRGKDKIRKAVKGVGSIKIDQAIDELISIGAVEDRGDKRGRSYHPTGTWVLDGLGDIREVANDFLDLMEPEESEATQEDISGAD